ncbi:hypothetical protein P7C71_g2762, partial [Lecanoromycetidae sp. Uapishka_2]
MIESVISTFFRHWPIDKICDFAEWLQFYAFDVIGEITYSKRHGFVERAEDVDARMAERLTEIEVQKSQGVLDPEKPMGGNRRGDLLSMFLKAKAERPDFFHDGRVLTMAVSMAFAGSETTAISLAATFYFLLKNPHSYEKLVQEIDDAVADGRVENRSDGIVSWTESQMLPYLDACIKEAFRLHPAPGLPLERIVPAQGAEICGERIPGGAIVGCSAWVIHRRPEIYGKDVEVFRPERWLEADKEKRKLMESCMLQFSMGARTCIGKNISLLEIYKLIPSFIRRFEVRLAHPEQDWKLHNAWFVKQLNFNTTFKPRSITT